MFFNRELFIIFSKTNSTIFTDAGTFFSRRIYQWGFELQHYEGAYRSKIYADAGLGFRLSTSIFEKDIHLRFDMPFLLYDDEFGSRLNKNNWVFSFQRSF